MKHEMLCLYHYDLKEGVIYKRIKDLEGELCYLKAYVSTTSGEDSDVRSSGNGHKQFYRNHYLRLRILVALMKIS